MRGEHVEYEGRDLEAMAFARNYHAWIRDQFAEFVRGDVAEVGAGDGAFSALLLPLAPRSLTLFEPSAAMHARQPRQLRSAPWLRRVNAAFGAGGPAHAGAFDCLLYVNVLEHIGDDERELALAFEALRPGGHLCVFVPALPWLMSDFDRRIGHHRRYRRHELRRKLRTAGFAVRRDHYLDCLGVLPWLLCMRLGRRDLSPAAVVAYDRHVVPALRALETRVRPLIGKNVLAVAQRPPRD
jgi:SAM-dependent methyltransferase